MRDCRTRLATKKVHQTGLPVPLKGTKFCKGQTLIEVALVLMTFFVLAFALIDFSWLMFSLMNIQDAVREAGRYASTGNLIAGPNGSNLSRIASITQILDDAAVGGNITNCTVAVSSVSATTGATTNNSAGGPNDTVTVTATCAIPLLTPGIGKWFPVGNAFKFSASSTFVNEPFSPNTPTT